MKSNDSRSATDVLSDAITLVRNRNLRRAREVLGIPVAFTEEQVADAMFSLDKAIAFIRDQNHPSAAEFFDRALPILRETTNDELRLMLPILTQFSKGLSALFKGDAHKAAELLNVSSAEIERISFLFPQYRLEFLSQSAAAYVAMARSKLNAGDIESAEALFGKVREVHNKMLAALDDENPDKIKVYVEVYATRLELTLLYSLMMDIPALDLEMLKRRLLSSLSDKEKLEQFVSSYPQGHIRTLVEQYPLVFEVVLAFQEGLETLILERKNLDKVQLSKIIAAGNKLFEAKKQVQTCGIRGAGFLYTINLLLNLQKNILHSGRPIKRDFGIYGGVISLLAFICLTSLQHASGLSTELGIGNSIYLLGSLILSLVAGFGYGAIKFLPLLKLLSKEQEKT